MNRCNGVVLLLLKRVRLVIGVRAVLQPNFLIVKRRLSSQLPVGILLVWFPPEISNFRRKFHFDNKDATEDDSIQSSIVAIAIVISSIDLNTNQSALSTAKGKQNNAACVEFLKGIPNIAVRRI